MKSRVRFVALLCALTLTASFAQAQQQVGPQFTFTVSMEKPANQTFHVVMQCDGAQGAEQLVKMPVWSPGYYGIMNYAENVSNFEAKDAAGTLLKFEKTAKNAWKVQNGASTALTISYDVKAARAFVANPFLDETRGYIIPGGTFMYIDGQLQRPSTVVIKPYKEWKNIATGLDPVEGKDNVFTASNFDFLFDCPILIGNLTELPSFEVKGIKHRFIGYNLQVDNPEQFMGDLKKMVEAAVGVVGEIPYKHYVFMGIGPGAGGVEHTTSCCLSLSPRVKLVGGELAFIAHEYFHNYNVKSIRPFALGPFDYDKENYTYTLWLSEGGTVYYEWIILNRAGFMSRQKAIDAICKVINSYESVPGHLYQSVAEASYQTWKGNFFGGGDKTISYYDKGAGVCALLDLRIRYETKGKKSLDDVMTILYQKYFKEKKRGFTEEELREVAEKVAGCNLADFYDYVYTTKDIDYAKYFAYAGLEIVKPKEADENTPPSLGMTIEETDGKWTVTAIEDGSPARNAGLRRRDIILTADGKPVTADSLAELVKTKKLGDKMKVEYTRRDENKQADVFFAKSKSASFKLKQVDNPTDLQKEILNGWLKE